MCITQCVILLMFVSVSDSTIHNLCHNLRLLSYDLAFITGKDQIDWKYKS